MNESEAQGSVRAVEQMWEIELGPDRAKWAEQLLPYDSVTVSSAILRLYETSGGNPTVEELVAAVIEMGLERKRFEEPKGPSVLDANPMLEPWVVGWAVARYRHQDFRVLEGQKEGYDYNQINNPGYRTYVWPDHEVLPAEDAARYIEEGSSLSVAEIFRMISA